MPSFRTSRSFSASLRFTMGPALRARSSAVLCVLALAGHATSAFAAPEAPPAETGSDGERLFREGRALMLEGRFDEACPKLEESQRVEPHTGTLLNVAACHEKQGRVATAWAEFQRALTAARAEGQADRERLADERIQALAPRVPWLAIAITDPPPDLEVTLDGARIDSIAWGKDMPVDPGKHVVRAIAAGRAPMEAAIELREGERRTVAAVLAAAPSEKKPDTIILPADAGSPHEEPPLGRWVLEAGISISYLSIHARSNVANTTATSGAAAGGVLLRGAYAFSPVIDAGLALHVGPVMERGGGVFFTFGPDVMFHPGGRVSFGASVFFADASTQKTLSVLVDRSYQTQDVALNLNGGGGAAAKVAVRIAELPRGAIEAWLSPYFIGGSMGEAWGLPLGISYRYQ